MKAIPPIKSVMTPFPHWIEADATLSRARALMAEHGIRHLPVMEHGKLVSVLSDRDLRGPGATGGSAASDLRVRDACSRGAYVVGLTEPLDRVLLHMAVHHLDAALVVKEGKLAGIFTSTDACLAFGKLLRALFPPGGDEAA
jgi:acetoin utilization protein AcuB